MESRSIDIIHEANSAARIFGEREVLRMVDRNDGGRVANATKGEGGRLKPRKGEAKAIGGFFLGWRGSSFPSLPGFATVCSH